MLGYKKALEIKIKDNFVYYKLRHIPTGLFYRPASFRYKSNLHGSGVIYSFKPNLILREGPLSKYRDSDFKLQPIILSEWQIITYKVKIQAVEEIPIDIERPVYERKRSNDNSTTNSAQGEILENIKKSIKRKI